MKKIVFLFSYFFILCSKLLANDFLNEIYNSNLKYNFSNVFNENTENFVEAKTYWDSECLTLDKYVDKCIEQVKFKNNFNQKTETEQIEIINNWNKKIKNNFPYIQQEILICEDYLNSFYDASTESKNSFTIKMVSLSKIKKLAEDNGENIYDFRDKICY